MPRTWVLVAAAWTAYTIPVSLQTVEFDPTIKASEALGALLPSALFVWTPITLAMLAVARRWPLAQGRRTLRIMQLLGVIFAALVFRLVGDHVLNEIDYYLLPVLYEPWGFFDDFFPRLFSYNVKVLQIVGFCYAWVYVQAERENRERIAELEMRVARMRLDAMAAQLNPHFLFDTLHGIARLAHTDAHAADHMLTTFSSLLRFSLAHRDDTIDLAEEVELAGQYFAIEKIRLGGRLEAQWSVQPGLAGARVPALIVQALAERVIPREPPAGPFTLRISIRDDNGALAVGVTHEPGGEPAGAPPRDFAEVRARLDGLYRGRSTLEPDAAGVRVTLPQ